MLEKYVEISESTEDNEDSEGNLPLAELQRRWRSNELYSAVSETVDLLNTLAPEVTFELSDVLKWDSLDLPTYESDNKKESESVVETWRSKI